MSDPEDIPRIKRRAYEDGRQAGIKEALDWHHEPCPHKSGRYFARNCAECTQAKLKEWGIGNP